MDAIAARRGLPCLLALIAISLFAAVHAVPVDTSDMCEMWAPSGECDANPDYMRQNCAASCAGAKAKPGGYASQMKRECVGYARQGECSRNPAFMLSTCRAECDAWEAENGLRIDRLLGSFLELFDPPAALLHCLRSSAEPSRPAAPPANAPRR